MKSLHAKKNSAAAAALRVAALAGILLIAACGNDESAANGKAGAAAKPPAMPVEVTRVEPRQVPISLEAVGRAEGSREVEIRARVSGIIEKRLYKEGERVKAGQTLFVIDRKPFEIAVAQAKAAVAQERARQEQAQREAKRLKPLVDSKAISQREYDDAVSTYKQASAAIQVAQAKLDEAQLNLSYTNVKAPIGGITSRAVRSEGSLVTANTDLLTTITQVDPIWVRFALAESDFDRIRGKEAGAEVKILNRDGSVAAGDGRLNFTGSTVDPKLGTVGLRAAFPNGRLQWLPGQFLRVRVLAGEQKAFIVPQAAVMQSEQGRTVWVVEDGKATVRPVETGNWIGSDWVITDGLKPGDAVIVDNLMKLRPGAPVAPHGPRERGKPPAGNAKAAPSDAKPAASSGKPAPQAPAKAQ